MRQYLRNSLMASPLSTKCFSPSDCDDILPPCRSEAGALGGAPIACVQPRAPPAMAPLP